LIEGEMTPELYLTLQACDMSGQGNALVVGTEI
jgi:hypothetical protein